MEVHGYTQTGYIEVTINGLAFSVPDDLDNRHRQMIAEWEAQGNTIPPYVPTPPDPLTLPIEPAPFWNAVFDLFGMKDTDVLDAIEDPDQRYLATNSIARRKTYQRDNETFIQLAALKGYSDPTEVDTLWRYIQTNYS